MTKKGFTVIEGVVIVALILVVVGIVSMSKKKTGSTTTIPAATNSVTPNIDETADWKTYTNTKYGYSFKYPNSWNFMESPDKTRVIATPGDIDPVYDGAMNFVVHYYTMHVYGGFSFDGHREYKNLNDYFSDEGITNQKIGETTLGGVKAYEVEIGGMGINFGIVAERSNGIYEISFDVDRKANLSAEDKSIISSFQFTK